MSERSVFCFILIVILNILVRRLWDYYFFHVSTFDGKDSRIQSNYRCGKSPINWLLLLLLLFRPQIRHRRRRIKEPTSRHIHNLWPRIKRKGYDFISKYNNNTTHAPISFAIGALLSKIDPPSQFLSEKKKTNIL